MKTYLALLILAALIGFSGVAKAETVSSAAAPQKLSKTKTQEVRFDALDVDGKSRTPDASYLSQKRGIKFLPLYKTKQDWEKKIQELAEYER